MIDFTSALYLGLNHASDDLTPWTRLSTGTSASPHEPAMTIAVAHRLASWIGQPAALLAPSTLHVFWDLFALLARAPARRKPGITIHVDAASYPIAGWGLERIEREIPVFHFKHQNPESLNFSLTKAKRLGLIDATPIVVCDGACASCGQSSPIADYLAILNTRPTGPRGCLVLDDTQALGLLGLEGSGSLRALPSELRREQVIHIASLAKALGVPLAVISASSRFIQTFHTQAETRLHCSPPNAAALSAAQHALDFNEKEGDPRRQRLRENVDHFKARLAEHDLETSGGSWPFRVLTLPSPQLADTVQRRLRTERIACIRLEDIDGKSRLGFLLNAAHTKADLDHAAQALGEICHDVAEVMPEPILLCERV